MKSINRIITCSLIGLLMIGCSQENELSNNESSIVVQDIANLKTQIPNPMLDASMEGIYHGVVASGTTQSRGKIWVNVGNNSNYNALIELVGGATLEFELDPDSVQEAANMTIFEFTTADAQFTLNLTNSEQPQISNIVLFNEAFFGMVVKSMSNNMASSATATFTEAGNPSFSGTWNLLADGSNTNPNGNNGDGITSVLITIDGDAYEDLNFDDFNATDCLGISNYVPTLNSYGLADYTICDYQTSTFAGGMAKWYLSFDSFSGSYMNYLFCESSVGGTFDWTSDDGTINKVGEIMLD